jgi:hypothetical protein
MRLDQALHYILDLLVRKPTYGSCDEWLIQYEDLVEYPSLWRLRDGLFCRLWCPARSLGRSRTRARERGDRLGRQSPCRACPPARCAHQSICVVATYQKRSERPQPLDCRVTCQLMRFRARSCMPMQACSQVTFNLLPRYKRHWAGALLPPRLGFQVYLPGRARANRANGANGPSSSQNRSSQIEAYCDNALPSHQLTISSSPRFRLVCASPCRFE